MTLQEFIDKYLGKQVEYHSFGGQGTYNQCTDLCNAYIDWVLGKTAIIGTNAKDFGKNYKDNEFEWIPNTPTGIPTEGDIVVWNGRVGGGAGHVAIYLSGDVNSFVSLDQNWSKKEIVTIETHNYNSVSGWLHPKGLNPNNGDNMELQEVLQYYKVKSADELIHMVDEQLKFLKDARKTVDELRGEIDTLNTQIGGYKSRITDLTNQVGPLQAEVENKEEIISRRNEEIAKLNNDINTLVNRLNDAASEIDKLGKDKGSLAKEVSTLKVQVDTLKKELAEGEFTLSIPDVIRLLIQGSIKIRRSK